MERKPFREEALLKQLKQHQEELKKSADKKPVADNQCPTGSQLFSLPVGEIGLPALNPSTLCKIWAG